MRAVTGDGIAVVEMTRLNGIELDLAAVVEACRKPTVGMDGLDGREVAIGDAKGFVWGCELDTVAIDSTTGALTQLAGSPFSAGKDPLRIASDPSGKLLFTVNSQDNTVSAFTIDATSGNLVPVVGSPFPVLAAPDALTVDPTGAFLYVADSSSSGGDISVFRISAGTGVLNAIGGSPFSTGQQSLSGLAIAKTH